jgi:hypothetical protein
MGNTANKAGMKIIRAVLKTTHFNFWLRHFGIAR